MIPDTNSFEYLAGLRERGYDLFTEELYDEIPPGEIMGDSWNFEGSDESSPHYPWPIRWHRGFAALRSLHERLETLDSQEVNANFGVLIENLLRYTAKEGEEND
jgi:hypothetical protein